MRPRTELAALAFALASTSAVAHAKPPEWLVTAARTEVSETKEDDAVVVFAERNTVVDADGGVRVIERRAIRVMHPRGESAADVSVAFGGDVSLRTLRGWHLPAAGKPETLKESDAIEVSTFDPGFHSDLHVKVLAVHGATPGSVVGFETELKIAHGEAPALDDVWVFQEDIPVLRTRYSIAVPAGWSTRPVWRNHEAAEGASSWELTNVPALRRVPMMPASRAIAGQLAIRLIPAGQPAPQEWDDIARWYSQLTRASRDSTPEIEAKVRELTSGTSDPFERMRLLSRFVQRETRYVAVEFGIGNLRPHPASEVFANRFGDCKDKAALLASMLHAAGIESFYVPIHTHRGVTARDVPTIGAFNHVVLAIPVGGAVPAEYRGALAEDAKLGRLLFFDPTDPLSPLGRLSLAIDGGLGLVVTGTSGRLVQVPASSAADNRVRRVAELTLAANGDMEGKIRVTMRGLPANATRSEIAELPASKLAEVVAVTLAADLGALMVRDARVENLREPEKDLVLSAAISVPAFGSSAGNLLIVRSSIFRRAAFPRDLAKRQSGIDLRFQSSSDEEMTLSLPPGLEIDEVPSAARIEFAAATYTAATEAHDHRMRVVHTVAFTARDIPSAQFGELQKFLDQTAAADRASVVLKRVSRP